jgi:hypothetical protein
MHETTLDSSGKDYSVIDDALRGVQVGEVHAEKVRFDNVSQENPKASLFGTASPLLSKNIENSQVTGVQPDASDVPVEFGKRELRENMGSEEITVPLTFRKRPSHGSVGFVPTKRWTRDNYPTCHPVKHGKGRPSTTFTALCKAYGAEIDPDYPDRTRLESLVVRVWNAAFDGDARALKEILSRTDPAVRKVAVEGVAADLGNAMLRRMLDSGVFPVRPGYELPVVEADVLEVVQVQEAVGDGAVDGGG